MSRLCAATATLAQAEQTATAKKTEAAWHAVMGWCASPCGAQAAAVEPQLLLKAHLQELGPLLLGFELWRTFSASRVAKGISSAMKHTGEM
jgi:hypothetical protein